MVYLLVGIAGALGAMVRYIIGLVLFTNVMFPMATLIINLIGSYLLAWFTTNLFQRIEVSPELKTAIGTGFVGSFTTFSTLSVETINLFRNGLIYMGILYILFSLFGGLLMCRLGYKHSVKEKML
ncbi:fluoride efflux transporter CrcB [Pallidibacillus thermolactis]|jgi:fluoride exporter|uniref:fluoride efflux transporter CrcB n=1 Tax=Pallidibacillus thermolactis TaxID=251051 RepID=UPI002E1EC68B|nr:fluoride efflux transporter CrcB [Pallidibacillus thermolactis]MED1674543.1 fluoride efflux transporter CrcB [Pallidibacillus thermolactis subsp. kokeshiiformis]